MTPLLEIHYIIPDKLFCHFRFLERNKRCSALFVIVSYSESSDHFHIVEIR